MSNPDALFRMGQISERAGMIVAQAEQQSRDITQDESDEIDRLILEFERLDDQGEPDAVYYARIKLKIASAQ